MTPLELATLTQEWITLYAVQPLLILFIGVFLGKVLEQALLFAFNELKLRGMRYEMIAFVSMWVVFVGTVLAALSSIGLLSYILWFFAGVITTVALLWILLGVKDFFPNAWSHSAVRSKFKVGSSVKNKLFEGTVVAVRLIDTHVKTNLGEEIYVPNKTMLKLRR